MRYETYSKKKDERGEPILENGDFVMELVAVSETPDESADPDWIRLEKDLRHSPCFEKAFVTANPNGFSLFTSVIINGKSGQSSESSLKAAFGLLGVNWSEDEFTELNEILSRNNFNFKIEQS